LCAAPRTPVPPARAATFAVQGPGLAVDAQGGAVIDPSANVLALVDASTRRQDDLREAAEKLREVQIGHIAAIGTLRAEYDEKLRKAETARIDAIRAVDVGAVTRAAEVSAQQANTLASQVTTSAETLRGQVEAARQATAAGLATALAPITAAVDELRRAQYEQQGQKSGVAESGASRDQSRTLLVALAGVALAVAVLVSPHIHTSPSTTPAPVVVTVPVPATTTTTHP
jgi:hypothetical protein